MKTLLIATAASALLAGAAMAQTPAQPAAPAAQVPNGSPMVSDDELKNFIALSVETQKITADSQAKLAAAGADADAQAKAKADMTTALQAAVAASGFTVARYNEIATRMQTDKPLAERYARMAAPAEAPAGG